MPKPRWPSRERVRWHRVSKPQQGSSSAPLSAWDWQYLNTQGFANVLQIVTLVLAAISFKLYFIPEQTLKRLDEKKIELEDKVATLERTMNKKDSEIATKTELIAAQNLDLTRISKEKAEAETARNRAVAEARAAIDRADAAKKELGATQLRLQGAEVALKQTQANVVWIRQEARRRLIGALPAYIAQRCAFTGMPNLMDCAANNLSTGEFSSLFSSKEMQTAISELRVYAEPAEKEWRGLSSKLHQEAAQLVAACASIAQQSQKSQCERDASEKGLAKLQALDPFETVKWIADRLKPWVSGMARNPGCPRLGKGELLPGNWPAGCL